MKFLFVVGVEGTGHGMLRSVLHGHLQLPTIVDQGGWHRLLVEHWDACQRSRVRDTSLHDLRSLETQVYNILAQYELQGVTHLFESASFPYGNPRDALRRPDLIGFHDVLAGVVDIRYLVCYRNPVAAAYSAIRRGFTDNVYLQARIVESNLVHIERQFRQLPAACYRVLPFERFCQQPLSFTPDLAKWWDLDEAMLVHGAQSIAGYTGLDQIPPETRGVLEEFFTERRVRQWHDFFTRRELAADESHAAAADSNNRRIRSFARATARPRTP